MHVAYKEVPILEKLPQKIESIACYDDMLLVGTSEGHLPQYCIRKSRAGDTKYKVILERSNKAFSKKAILQQAVIPELSLLISLSDYVVSVHDLRTFEQIVLLTRTKGATLFEVDVQKQAYQSGNVQPYFRMCVAVKRKLQTELICYDIPRAMAWCNSSVCVGFEKDYFLIKVNTGETKELFTTGSLQPEPVVKKIDENMLLLGHDKMAIFIDADGNPMKNQPLTWSDVPFDTVYDPPYLIAVLPEYIEVQSMEPPFLIQSLKSSGQKARYICKGSGNIYIASSNYIWQLNATPITSQIEQLVQRKEFHWALQLADMTEEPELEKHTRMSHIKTLYAFHLFCQHKFQESMQIFVKLETDPSIVIGMYPDLLPPQFQNPLVYPEKLPELEGGDLKKAMLALIDYLLQKRQILMKDEEVLTTAIKEGNKTIKSKDELSQIIDTTLLKCFLETNDALVAPLLRLKYNKCCIEESEYLLRKKTKFSELIILYENKGFHEKALLLLMKEAAIPCSPLRGHKRTVQYLQHLGAEHLNLIFEYGKWVFKESPEDGLKIFTEDLPEVESLPRDKVLQYLQNISKDLAIPYLEHVISDCCDETEEFHYCLGFLLQEKVQTLMVEYIRSLPEGHLQVETGREPGELGVFRTRLIKFLKSSMFYKPERLITHFPLDGLFEERAILLGRLGRHEQALGIYILVLKDKKLAEEYCMHYYDKSKEGNKDVYVHLLKMYLQPPTPSSLGLLYSGNKPQIDIPAALNLIQSVKEVALPLVQKILHDNNIHEHGISAQYSNPCSESSKLDPGMDTDLSSEIKESVVLEASDDDEFDKENCSDYIESIAHNKQDTDLSPEIKESVVLEESDDDEFDEENCSDYIESIAHNKQDTDLSPEIKESVVLEESDDDEFDEENCSDYIESIAHNKQDTDLSPEIKESVVLEASDDDEFDEENFSDYIESIVHKK